MNLLDLTKRIGVQGFMHPDELEKLADLAIGKDVLEIGSFMGLSAFAMAIGAKKILCVDTFRANTAGQHQLDTLQTLEAFDAATARFKNVERFVGTSEDAGRFKCFEQQKFDLIFLDAMHTYQEVKADINRWYPYVHAGGVMAFHDYRHDDFPGVEKAVDEVFGPAPAGTTVGTLRWIEKK
jgi:predicted O-methyltransferase YrrM